MGRDRRSRLTIEQDNTEADDADLVCRMSALPTCLEQLCREGETYQRRKDECIVEAEASSLVESRPDSQCNADDSQGWEDGCSGDDLSLRIPGEGCAGGVAHRSYLGAHDGIVAASE